MSVGIHIDKSAATWRSQDGVINMIIPQRCDTALPSFKVKISESDADADLYANSRGSQYSSANVATAALDTTNFVNATNVILFMCRVNVTGMDFDRNNMFPLLYQTVVNEGSGDTVTMKRYVQPFFYAMFPQVYYDEHSDRLTLTFWNNVKVYANGPQEKFGYRPFCATTSSYYEIYNVISSDDTTVETGIGRRALFCSTGTKFTANFDTDIIFNTKHSNPAPTTVPPSTVRDYHVKEIYLFDKPRIVFIPDDSTAEPVVDIGAGGGLSDHLHLKTNDGGTAYSALYPSTDALAADSGLVHVIPASLQSGISA